MAKNVSERCLAGLKCIEEQLRDASITLEALNSYVNTNIFMINNNIPSNIDDLILLDTVLNYFNNHKDEQVKRSVFNFLFSQKNDLRKMDFLVKLTSLSVATLSSGVLDIISGWIKNNIPKQLLHILIRRLLTDILSIDENRNNLLKLIPDASISFTGAFLIGLTETYQFIQKISSNLDLNLQKSIDNPSIGLLHHVLEWVQKHKQQLFNQPIISSPPPIHGSSDELRNTPFSGLLFWTLSHPLSKINEENYIEENKKENDLVSELHYELLDYMDGLIKASNPYLLSTDYLKYIVETVKRFEVPQTPQSPLHGQEEANETNKIESGEGCKRLDLVLIRLSGVIQIGMKNECMQCSNNELLTIFKDLRTHRYINAVLKALD